jgi:hypothetical protein
MKKSCTTCKWNINEECRNPLGISGCTFETRPLWKPKIITKEETIEEAAKEAISYLKGVITTLEDARKLFIKGANYQKEQMNFGFEEGYKASEKHYKDLKAKMYTEEEVYNIFIKWFDYTTEGIIDFEDWFENNKKK